MSAALPSASQRCTKPACGDGSMRAKPQRANPMRRAAARMRCSIAIIIDAVYQTSARAVSQQRLLHCAHAATSVSARLTACDDAPPRLVSADLRRIDDHTTAQFEIARLVAAVAGAVLLDDVGRLGRRCSRRCRAE